MKQTVLSASLQAMFAVGAVAAAAVPAFAQQALDQPMQRVEITGSSIKRIQAEGATPLTVIKAEEFAKQGLTTAQEALSRVASNQTTMGSGNAVGGNTSGLPTGGQASADLRGLGGDKTLVLLNGRRLANHPYDGASVDLNMIPISALERVEVLRDGASAIYGTDAIGGVINFITKRSVTTTTITAEAVRPRQAGADEERINLSTGWGDLDRNGFNVFAVVDWHRQQALTSQQRAFSQTGIQRSRGLDVTSGTTFPGNYYDPGSGVSGNPGFASGCDQPFSVPSIAPGAQTCRQDYTRQIDNLPAQEQKALYAKASMKVGNDHTASLEFLHSENDVVSRTAPPPQTGLVLPTSSKYYPGNSGGVPAQPGLSGQPLSVNWRPLEAGPRMIDSKGQADRLVAALVGVQSGWDYKTGLAHSISKSSEDFTGGYVKDSSFAKGVFDGVLNPFALQDAAGKAYLDSTALRGRVQSAKVTNTAFDATASRELMPMAGGQLAVAVGAEMRREKADFDVNREIASQASSSGLSGSLPKTGSRNIQALFGELSIPLVKDLEVQLAARFDRYSDVGNTTNPKIGVRYQPTRQLLLRGSASTGFRAPTLFEKNGPPSRNDTNDSYNDPILCPDGNPQPGANPLRDCDLQQYKLQGGNANLKPEKSRTFSVGMVVEPTRELTIAADYWNIHLKDKIGAVPEKYIFDNYAKYKDRFLRFPDGSPNAILDMLENLGEVKTDGVDLSVNLRLPRYDLGLFSLGMDGTWVHKYEYQNVRDEAFFPNVGRYGDMGPVFRWQHNLTLAWSSGAWSAILAQSFKTSYVDQGDGEKVGSYSLWNISGSYSGIKGLTLTAGVKNLLDKDPPFTAQGTMFQKGYDPRYTDPVGRALFMRASYSF
jgi:iron complex outermembrane receptor protein